MDLPVNKLDIDNLFYFTFRNHPHKSYLIREYLSKMDAFQPHNNWENGALLAIGLNTPLTGDASVNSPDYMKTLFISKLKNHNNLTIKYIWDVTYDFVNILSGFIANDRNWSEGRVKRTLRLFSKCPSFSSEISETQISDYVIPRLEKAFQTGAVAGCAMITEIFESGVMKFPHHIGHNYNPSLIGKFLDSYKNQNNFWGLLRSFIEFYHIDGKTYSPQTMHAKISRMKGGPRVIMLGFYGVYQPTTYISKGYVKITRDNMFGMGVYKTAREEVRSEVDKILFYGGFDATSNESFHTFCFQYFTDGANDSRNFNKDVVSFGQKIEQDNRIGAAWSHRFPRSEHIVISQQNYLAIKAILEIPTQPEKATPMLIDRESGQATIQNFGPAVVLQEELPSFLTGYSTKSLDNSLFKILMIAAGILVATLFSVKN